MVADGSGAGSGVMLSEPRRAARAGQADAEPAPTGALVLLLLDSRSPAGAHAHSGGMEAAVEAGWVSTVEDVERFCRGRLRTAGRVAAAFAAAAGRLAAGPSVDGTAEQWAELDNELEARTPSEAARRASRQLGSGLLRLLRASMTDFDPPWSQVSRPAPHHPLVLGAGVAASGGDPQLAARAAALGSCTGPATAAVRLLGLDPYAVHGMLAGLSGEIDAIAETSALVPLPATGAPALELLADVHLLQEVRLFAS